MTLQEDSDKIFAQLVKAHSSLAKTCIKDKVPKDTERVVKDFLKKYLPKSKKKSK